MNIKSFVFVSFMAILSLSRIAHANQVVTCNVNEYAQAYTQVQQVYNSEISQFKEKLKAINCLDKSPICDQIKLVALTTEYQLKVQKLTASYVEQDRLSLCYDIKSSTALAMESGFDTLVFKPASTLTSNTNNSKQLTTQKPNGAEVWIKTHAIYTPDCMNTQAALEACIYKGNNKGLVACRAGAPEKEADFHSNAIESSKMVSRAEVRCEGPSSVPEICINGYPVPGSRNNASGPYVFNTSIPVCYLPADEWNKLQVCYAKDRVKDRLATCTAECKNQPGYHVCDWTDEEWKLYSKCLKAGNGIEWATRDASCPGGNPDVDEDGPPPRISLAGFRVKDAPYNTFLVSSANHMRYEVSSVKGRSASYCTKKVGSNTCDNQSNYSLLEMPGGGTRGYVTLKEKDISPGDYTLVVLNNITGKTASLNFTVVSADMAFPCIPGTWVENTGMEFGPFAKTGTNPSSFYSGKSCDCAKNPEVKDSSNRRWQCTASSAPRDTEISGVSNNCIEDKGTFCNEEANLVTEWLVHACQGKPAGEGWAKQEENIYHRFTKLACGVAKPPASSTIAKPAEAVCNVINGEFCGGTHMTEWVKNSCGVVPDNSGWVSQGDNIWHKGTTRLCAN